MRFGVDTFIWSEVFSEKDLWVITKAEELGFSTIDIAIAHPETFPTALVKAELAKTKRCELCRLGLSERETEDG